MQSLCISFCDSVLETLRDTSTLASLQKMLELHDAGQTWEDAIDDHKANRTEFTFELRIYGDDVFTYSLRDNADLQNIDLTLLDRKYFRCEQLGVFVSERVDPLTLGAVQQFQNADTAIATLRIVNALCNYGTLQILRKTLTLEDDMARELLDALNDGYFRSLNMSYYGWRGNRFLRNQCRNVFLRDVRLYGDWGAIDDVEEFVARTKHLRSLDLEKCPHLWMTMGMFKTVALKLINQEANGNAKMNFKFDLNRLDSFKPQFRDRLGHRAYGFYWRFPDNYRMVVTAQDSMIEIHMKSVA